MRFIEVTERTREILMNIIGNLDKDGFLGSTHEELAQALHGTVEEVREALDHLHTMDPPGVGARDLQECLMLQLVDLGLDTALEGRIIANHLDKVEKRKFDAIAKAEKVELSAVKSALETIQRLEPRPGRPFNDDTIRYMIPDVYVHKDGSDYVVTLNEDGLPKLKISPYYLELLKNTDKENAPNKSYLTERLKAASWLIKSIHQRQSTIYKVAESIVKFQREFLDEGIHKIRPLVLKDVADDIGMHESTVSRVTTNKFIHTPQGVFELKFFFSAGLRSASGEDISTSSIKEKIKGLIMGESKDAPLSDQDLVEILAKENITIARRTVAKYREALGIESSSRRKNLF
jgi:RNA polymerase sigma-54 factor